MVKDISRNNFIQHELIGLHAKIIDTPCKSSANISGQIIDETMNTFKIEYFSNDQKKTIIVPKNKTRFRFTLPGTLTNKEHKSVEIDGALLTKRPEDRIKKLAKIVHKINRNKKRSYSIGD